ncbi:GDSL esterase/lipase [Acorus gramineus]|uniref:GDSL esterase/lipase n=1 Tax=Acorus gramineus TaxID=55184 RepID=A0AAV9BE25_ACOGR|nr:GDSL esterase/lipase [Acorus gramineus]
MDQNLAVLVLALSLLSLNAAFVVEGVRAQAMFVFGDSLVDPGNNNDLLTLAKANYFPNGIDFSGGATGRFCNGRTTADYLGNLIGLPLIPAFNGFTTMSSRTIPGINFASAGAGILNDTGRHFGQLCPMDEQIKNFRRILREITSKAGGIDGYLGKSLFLVGVGSNDYINNYLFPTSDRPNQYTPNAYHQLLIQEYERQLKNLYDLGGRRFLIAGLGPLGCIPNQIGYLNQSTNNCVERINRMASRFNSKLKSMLRGLNSNLSEAYFLYWDIYTSSMDIINNASHYGFKYTHKACCGGGRTKGQIICLPLLPFECENRSEFVFWDPYHPTDAFNAIISREAYQGKLQNKYPMNVQHLIEL